MKKSILFLIYPFLLISVVIIIVLIPKLFGTTIMLKTTGYVSDSANLGETIYFNFSDNSITTENIDSVILRNLKEETHLSDKIYITFKQIDNYYVIDKVIATKPETSLYLTTVTSNLYEEFTGKYTIGLQSFYYPWQTNNEYTSDDIDIIVEIYLWKGYVLIKEVQQE